MGVAQGGAAPPPRADSGVVATVRLTLEIERDAEAISGRLTGPCGQQREFFGWTALATIIDTALDTDSDSFPGAQEGERQS
jgi:hypothetical protein